MQKLKIVVSDVAPGKYSSYIPPIFRHICGTEVEVIVNTVPPEHAENLEPLSKMLLEAAQKSAEQADLIIISGGYDVSPALYGQIPHPMTDQTPRRSFRDEIESEMIRIALEKDIPMVQICRGYQLGLVMEMKNEKPEVIKFCQHLPDVTTGIHRTVAFSEGKELIFNSQYLASDFIKDMENGVKSPLSQMPGQLHKVRIYPGTITHYLYKNALGLPASYKGPIEVDEMSSHHQGFVINSKLALPEGFVCSALSLAGDEVPILEGYENTRKALCIGMQWHPEINATGKVKELFRQIANYAEFYKDNKNTSFREWAGILPEKEGFMSTVTSRAKLLKQRLFGQQ